MSSQGASWLSAIAVSILTIVGFVLFANTRVHTSSSSASNLSPPSSNTTVPATSYVNSTQLSDACMQTCGGAGGVCTQSTVTGITRCSSCGGAPGVYSLNQATGVCINTAECTTYPWCTAPEGVQLSLNHTTLVYHSWFGPGPLNFTYPFLPTSRYSELTPFVPLFAADTTAVAALLNLYVAGQLATGGGGANTLDYFTDEGSYWSQTGGNLALYKSALPSLYGPGYIQVIKRKICRRTWLAVNGTCTVPPI